MAKLLLPASKLTQSKVDELEKTGSKVRLPDHKQSGLYLRMTATGAKSYVIIYRDIIGKQREMAIGAADKITLEMARDRARGELGKLSGGGNPIEERRAAVGAAKARAANTVAGLAERYQQSARFKGLKPSTRAYYEQCLNTYILPELGEMPVQDVKRATVADFLDTLRGSRTDSVANSAKRSLSALFSFAIERDMIEYNPVSGVKQAGRRTIERERVLEDWELKRLWAAVGEQDGMSDTVADMLRLLMLLPARRGEVAGMMWEELDLEEGLWAIPAERMKAGRKHELPLSASAVAMLKARRQQLEKEAAEEKRKVLPWVFPDAAGEGPMDGKRAGKVCGRLAEKWRKEREKEAGEPVAPSTFGPHDLRRTFTTRITELAGKRGFTVDNIRRVIAHNVYGGEAFANYDFYQYREEKRTIVAAWEAELLRIVEGKAPPENVVPLRAASAAG